jgi:flagellar FliL protein
MAEDLEEEDEESGGSSEPAPSSGKPGLKKLLLFVVLPLILVVGGTTGAYFVGALDPVLAMFGGKKDGGGEKKEKDAPVAASVFYDLPEMLVNLNSTGRKQNYLKIKVSLELSSAADIARIEQVMPRVVNNFQEYLRELRVEDMQGSSGMYRLREELLGRVNATTKPAKVHDVLFKEMLVQ